MLLWFQFPFFAILFLTFSRVCACWNYATYVLTSKFDLYLEYNFFKQKKNSILCFLIISLVNALVNINITSPLDLFILRIKENYFIYLLGHSLVEKSSIIWKTNYYILMPNFEAFDGTFHSALVLKLWGILIYANLLSFNFTENLSKWNILNKKYLFLHSCGGK